MVRVGVIGFGLAGQVFHAPTDSSVVPGMELACIAGAQRIAGEGNLSRGAGGANARRMLADETIRLCVLSRRRTPLTSTLRDGVCWRDETWWWISLLP